MLEWVFFDVGNVLYNDDAQAFQAYLTVFQAIQATRPDYTFADMLAEREERARAGENWILRTLAKQRLPAEEIDPLFKRIETALATAYDANHQLNPGLPAVLERLQDDFRLGVVANQIGECRRSLERRELLGFFEVVAISEELGLQKPHAAIFEWALRASRVRPQDSVMVGDRQDNDVLPAKVLGMKTVWLRWPRFSSRIWRPADPVGRAFLASCERQPLFCRADQEDQADRTAADLFETVQAIQDLARESHFYR